MKLFRIVVLISIILFTGSLYAQSPDSPNSTETILEEDSKIVTAEKDFEAGWLHSAVFGAHWRDLWAAPFKVPVLNLNEYHGGLEVLPGELKGGKQSKVLKFRSADGSVYKFRSTLKFAKFAIDTELNGTIGEYIIQDQVSIKHPYAPMLAFSLLKTAGVLMPEPKMYVLSNDPKLNDYPDYKNLLGTMQEVPGTDDKPFNGFSKIIKTENLLKKMDKDSEIKVDGAEFLKARLMDIFMSDWDRHHKQWLWASKDSLKNWVPVSQDRDEAFCRYDGLVPWLFAEAVPRFEGISEDYPLIDFITWEGRYLDRKFLTQFTKSTWDSLTQQLSLKLTNSAIHDAVNTMPPEWYKLSGRKLENILRARRDKLNEISRDYYELIFHEPDIWASDKNETAVIEVNDEDRVSVKLIKEGEEIPFYQRTFDDETTSEVRIYLQGGDDKVILKGKRSGSIKIRIIGGKGKDVITDSSAISGGSLNLVFYDDNAVRETGNVSWNNDRYIMPKGIIEKIDPNPQDYGSLLTFLPALNYNTDEGIIFGGSSFFTRYGFRYNKFKYRLSLNGTYATRTRGYYFKFTSDYNWLVKNTGVSLDAELSGSQFSNFYGMGNASVLDKGLKRNKYYRIEQHRVQFDGMFNFTLTSKVFMELGFTLKSINTVNNINTIVSDIYKQQTGRINFGGINSAITYESYRSKIVPSAYLYARFSTHYFPGMFRSGYNFTKTKLELKGILFENFMKRSFFTYSVNGEKIFGTFPFYESAALGGTNGLRGFSKDRFAGDGAISASLDANVYLFNTEIVLPADISLLILTDAGRMFNKGEVSDKIHYSLGGGLNFGYYKRMFNLQMYAASSVEDTKFYLGALFAF